MCTYQSYLKKKDFLVRRRVWKETSMSGGLTSWLLNPKFRTNLKLALAGKSYLNLVNFFLHGLNVSDYFSFLSFVQQVEQFILSIFLITSLL